MPVTATGQFEARGDADFFRVYLEAGQSYQLSSGNGGPLLALRLPDGSALSGQSPLSNLRTFVAPVSGDYWLTAQEYGGITPNYTITLTTYVDPYPASIATPLTLAVGQSYTMNWNAANIGDDWYAVDLVAGQSYVFTSSNPTRSLYLMDADGGVVSVQSNDLHFTPSATGRYYAGVYLFGGSDYTLSLASVTDDHGTSAASAGSLAVGGSTTGVWEATRDSDWYAVTLTAGTSYLFTLASSNSSVRGTAQLYDAAGQLVETSVVGWVPNQLVFAPQATGTYYISAATGSYSGHVNPGYTLSASELTTDVLGNALTQASITVGTARQGRFDGPGDNDWYAVTLTAGQSYVFTVSTNPTNAGVGTGLLGRVYDSAGHIVATSGGSSGDSNAFPSLTATTSGTYYLSVRSNLPGGSYLINSATYTDDFADHIGTTGTLTVGGTATGVFEVDYDDDWFAVELVAGRSYSFSSPTAGIAMFDAQGNPMGANTGWEDFHVSPTVSGTYYLGASGMAGAYSVRIQQIFDDYREDPSSTGYLRTIVNGTTGVDVFTSTNVRNDYQGLDGEDWFIPGLGNDRFIGGAGIDTVSFAGLGSGVTLSLSNGSALINGQQFAAVLQTENVIGTNFDDVITGNGLANVLVGGGGNDQLNGGPGVDQLYGGTGNDSFVVDSTDDIVFEYAGEGTDTVNASGSYYLYPNIENLTLTGGNDNFGVGNELANTIQGNSGSNLLIAGAGDDIVRGGAGVDSLFGQDGNDQLFGDAGIDYLVGSVGNDMLDGGEDADALYGEDGDDTLIGGAGFHTDILVGGAGNDVLRGDSGLGDYDRMDGGSGDDSYYVDTPDDLTFEAGGGGTDTVYATINGAGYYLYANVENLVLGGDTPFGVGNDLDNRITGSAASNWLLGGAGNDTLNGAAGNDVLFGESGADTFVFARGTGGDVIGDFVAGTDRIDLSAFGLTWQIVLNSMHENGGATAIDLGNGDFIVLNGVARSALSESDFILSTARQGNDGDPTGIVPTRMHGGMSGWVDPSMVPHDQPSPEFHLI